MKLAASSSLFSELESLNLQLNANFLKKSRNSTIVYFSYNQCGFWLYGKEVLQKKG